MKYCLKTRVLWSVSVRSVFILLSPGLPIQVCAEWQVLLQILDLRDLEKGVFFSLSEGPCQVWGNSAGYTGKSSLSLGLWANRKRSLADIFGMISRRSFPTTFLQNHWFWQIGGGPWADSLTILVEKHMMHFQINGVLFTTPICVFMWSIRPQNSSSRTATTEFLAYNCNPFYMPSPSKPNPVSVCHQLYQSLWEPQVWP